MGQVIMIPASATVGQTREAKSLVSVDPVVLSELKRRLAVGLPDHGSSHISEALASSLGFRTHKELLACVKTGRSASVTGSCVGGVGDDLLIASINDDEFARRLGMLSGESAIPAKAVTDAYLEILPKLLSGHRWIDDGQGPVSQMVSGKLFGVARQFSLVDEVGQDAIRAIQEQVKAEAEASQRSGAPFDLQARVSDLAIKRAQCAHSSGTYKPTFGFSLADDGFVSAYVGAVVASVMPSQAMIGGGRPLYADGLPFADRWAQALGRQPSEEIVDDWRMVGDLVRQVLSATVPTDAFWVEMAVSFVACAVKILSRSNKAIKRTGVSFIGSVPSTTFEGVDRLLRDPLTLVRCRWAIEMDGGVDDGADVAYALNTIAAHHFEIGVQTRSSIAKALRAPFDPLRLWVA